jgi:tripartite-type tricarboxylate transporter receptor subunit TctC
MPGLSTRVRGSMLLAALVAGAGPAVAADFSGKTITFTVGYPPGGGYDTYARVFARDFGRHVPGRPNVVVQNQPGAGSLTAANNLYNLAPKDGTAIGLFASSAALEPLLGNAQAKFDTTGFTWIGNINKDVASCGVWRQSGVTKFSDLHERPTKFGGSGPAAITTQHAVFLKNMLGTKVQVVLGYGGTHEINLAMQRGEVDGSCGMLVSSISGPYAQDIQSGNLKIIIQFGRENVPQFGDATNVYSLLKTEEEKQIADFVFLQLTLGRTIAAPPGLSPDVTDTLRKAFDATMKDAEFLANAKKANIDIVPMTGAEVAEAYASFGRMSPAVIEKAKNAILNP